MVRVKFEACNGQGVAELLTLGEEDAIPEEASKATCLFTGFETEAPEDPDQPASPMRLLLDSEGKTIPYTLDIRSGMSDRETCAEHMAFLFEELMAGIGY
tara:strand:- start:1145 stop:1444 length:300 start_codon:yes stop_codon:yes gene_type:complete